MRQPNLKAVIPSRLYTWLAGCLFLLLSSLSLAQDFLPPERAFAMQARQVTPNVIAISYRIADGYYMYRDRLEIPSEYSDWQPAFPELPPGVVKYDPTFDQDMALFYGALEFMLELPPWPVDRKNSPFILNIISQGCADAGLCYPPMTSAIELEPDNSGFRLLRQQGLVDFETPFGKTALTGSVEISGSARVGGSLISGSAVSQAGWTDLLSTGSDMQLAEALNSQGRLTVLALFFALGLLLSFTPCVLPMIPILSAVIVGQSGKVTRLRGFALAVAYVAGMSVVYTILGVLAGLTGAGLAAWLQTPWVLSIFAFLLVVLALAMFDVITIEMPSSVQTRLTQLSSRLPGGHLTTAAAMGAISALIVGPCVAAPLAGALLYISQTGDVILGGSALFAMAWGMGVPLLIVGLSAGSLLPKAGPWMSGVKGFFGILLLATAWWMISPVLSAAVVLFGWSVLAIFSSVLLGTFEPLRSMSSNVSSGKSYYGAALRKTLGLMLVMLALIWLVGLASGSTSIIRPFEKLTVSAVSSAPSQAMAPAVVFEPVRSVEDLERAVSNSTRPVMLDFYADWCVSCKEMEAFTFPSPEVAQRMQQFTLLKADVTANNADDRALLRRFKLFGPPGIMFFEPGGAYREDIRVIGFQNAAKFAETLDQVLVSTRQ